MSFYADLHVHSKYSRATSRDGDLPHLALWARRKGIRVLGTGDFTHPAWFDEIRQQLIEAEPGLFALRPELCAVDDGLPPPPPDAALRFVLSVEISTIYKKAERTRKVHHLILVPDLEGAARLRQRLGQIGNIASDGRPILGLDSRDLLEILLESAPGGLLIPAHIWTPWFSVLGSRSGFDSIEECYGDLSEHIVAVETGLSSDPPMNARVSSLDRFRLVSNSDAHSPQKLGREACVFDTPLDYFAMRRALETGAGYGGTVEFFPEEGKYHLDGHRACGVVQEPGETRARQGLCPSCGKPVTVGVLHRVEELADRAEAASAPRDPVRSLIPLDEILGELEGVGAGSKKVRALCHKLVSALGPELWLLEHAPVDDVARLASPLLAEALQRLRRGEVRCQGGYDGEYGVIRLFDERELAVERRGGWLFGAPPVSEARGPAVKTVEPAPLPLMAPPPAALPPSTTAPPTGEGLLAGLDPEQRAAAEYERGPLLIVAGPGSGKTRTLTHRLAHLVLERGVDPARCLAITFTRRAAAELQLRLTQLMGTRALQVQVSTFHGLGLRLLRTHASDMGLPDDLSIASEVQQERAIEQACGLTGVRARRLRQRIRAHKHGALVGDDVQRARQAYDAVLRMEGRIDLDDLVLLPAQQLEHSPALQAALRAAYDHVCVDEYQDVDPVQVRLLRALVAPDGTLCVIGDPDQSIYGFRGSDRALFERFVDDFEGVRVVRLTRSYRLGQCILDASAQVLERGGDGERRLQALLREPGRILLHPAPTERAEAEFVVHSIERLLGGHSFFSLDSARSEGHQASLGLGDIAVLVRTERQAEPLSTALRRSGLPFQRRSHRRLDEQPGVGLLLEALHLLPAEGSVLARLHRAADLIEASAGEVEDSCRSALSLLEPLALQYGDDARGFTDTVSLGVEHDLWDARAERISLLTLHAAKGLEFQVVFLVGCEDGLLPLRFAAPLDDDELAEERRLFYVGMTRAARQLVLCHAGRRLWQGKVRERTRSPFVDAIADALLQHSTLRGTGPKKRRPDSQLDLF
ncbi:MAG: UvrD-helicase domain-containing protein [Pseudomonadota bacterium]